MVKVHASGTEGRRHGNVRDVFRLVVEQFAYKCIHEDRIPRSHDTVPDHRISAVLEIEVTADVIDDDKVLMNAGRQMGNRLMQPHGMKMPLLRVRDETLHIFESAGDVRLTVSFQDRNIDQEIDIFHAVADLQLHTGTVHGVGRVFLCVYEGYSVSV